MLNIKKKKHKYLLKLFSYIYILIGFSYIIYFISYNIRIANKLEGWAVMMFNALLYFIAYVVINHTLVRMLISNKLLMIIEILLFGAILTLLISDWKYEAYLHLKYLQRTMPVTITQ